MDTGPEIDLLILANHVEVINGLLYVSGGGWTDHHRDVRAGVPPPSSHLAIAASVRIPWTETNRRHVLAITIENADSTVTLARVDGEIHLGRPPHLPPGSEQHASFGIGLDVVFPDAGEYRMIASLNDGQHLRRWPFRVHDRINSAG